MTTMAGRPLTFRTKTRQPDNIRYLEEVHDAALLYFFVDEHSTPMALVELDDGQVRSILATDIVFNKTIDEQFQEAYWR